ncbi:hypothetical protein [Mesorhizobium sp. M0140]|uniref:hypothetical protein n=1 Tax=Mesorhizobium sp. M0140 TaxID=2956893 RepID=UPI00333BA3A7
MRELNRAQRFEAWGTPLEKVDASLPFGAVGSGWFAGRDDARMMRFGVRLEGGGAHQSKTLMLSEIGALVSASSAAGADFRGKILGENVLGKATASGRLSIYRNLSSLYGLSNVPAITKAFFELAKGDAQSRPLLALLVALARDPLLRDTAQPVVEALVGELVQWPVLANAVTRAHSGRFSEKMLRSLAQNCASTWTQTGHLEGRYDKKRRKVHATAPVAALAALIATVCGFSGPAMLSSAWFKILDLDPNAALDMLRSAEARGLARVRAAGDVIEISVRQQLAATLGVPDLEHV